MLGNIGSAQPLADLWPLYCQRLDGGLWNAISAIQNRCQFYNYEVWQVAMQRREEEKLGAGQGDEAKRYYFPNATEVKIFEQVQDFHESPPSSEG